MQNFGGGGFAPYHEGTLHPQTGHAIASASSTQEQEGQNLGTAVPSAAGVPPHMGSPSMYRLTASYTMNMPMIAGQPHRKTIQTALTRKKPTYTDAKTPARRSVPRIRASKKLGSLT